ncbi:Hint domain-containing protein [Rhodococcus aetherivorans]|uniref:Hint domain-containing protein n=1 Tax=Rhodococcus aetherivorans TaxID=191292 RepID=UPI0002D23DFB|nr:Hint domain-containing protein [Rhodococcus aetherivorans]CCW14612.1 hypothetical protein EBESD8_51820 [Rhodococcus aetherivorans]
MLPTASAEHYSDQRRIMTRVLALARRIWGTKPPSDFDSWFDRNVELLVAAVTAGQRQAVAGADGYVTDVLDELGTPVAAEAEPVTASLVGIASDGRGLDSLMYGAVITSKRGIGQGLALEDAWDLGMKALLLRVQTQVADAARVATGLSITARPRVGYVRMLNPPSCSRCALLAGKFYGHNRGFLRHPGCFPAGVTVSGPSVDASTRRWYEGELVVLTTASGQNLSLTGNHPILTRRGWIPANLLHEGDYVVRSTRPEGATPLVVPDHNQVPALIEDVWGSFAVNGLHRVPTAPEDFHGDGNVGEVDIVYPNRPLRGRENAAFGEHRVEKFLSGGSESAELLIEKGSSELVDVRGLPLSSNSVRGGGLELPFAGRQLRRTDQAGFLMAPDGHVCGDETFADDLARDSVLTGQGVLAGSGLVGGNDVLDGEFDSARWDAPAVPFSMESRAGYSSRGKELFDRLSGQIELDRVVVLSRVDWSGHVYNLTSSEGWHTANSLIVSNCDCRHIPTREDRADDVTTDPKAYFDSLTAEQQNTLFTRAGAEAIRDGADINQVVNAERGMATTQVYGRELATTTEGVTRRGIAYDAMRRAGYAQRDTDVRTGRYFQAKAPRLMPEAIYEIAEDRADALRLLRLYGYLT